MSGKTISTVISSCSLTKNNPVPYLQARRGYKSVAAAVLNSNLSPAISSSNYGSSFKGFSSHGIRRSFQYCKSSTKTDGTVHGSTTAATSGPPTNSWRNWILGALLSIILPFWKHKWAPFLALKKEVDNVVETVDTVIEAVEKVAEGVEKVADDVAERLPEGGKLQQAVCMVEQVAKKVHEDAQTTDEFIHKVEDVENEFEKGVETIVEAISSEEQEKEKIQGKEEEEEEAEVAVEEIKVEEDKMEIKMAAEAVNHQQENVESKKASINIEK